MKSWPKIEFITLAHHLLCVVFKEFVLWYSTQSGPLALHYTSGVKLSQGRLSHTSFLSFLKSKLPWEAPSLLTQFVRTACPHNSSWQGTHIHYPYKCHPPACPHPTAEQHNITSQLNSLFQVETTV